MDEIKLTAYSHGAGCGCKLSPDALETILRSATPGFDDARLLVGNEGRDDAAVYDLGGGQAVVSTTDFFMPIVDDPFDFGRVAAANAISDVYAMGARPIMAIAVLGWPVEVLPLETARRVLEGGRAICAEAAIPLAGGHSIDTPEPIFGLAVTGLVPCARIKRNQGATPGCLLYLTKPIGIGILTTAGKRGRLRPGGELQVIETMTTLNRIGLALADVDGIAAMTDVTGFGLLGHLLEMCEASGVSARIEAAAVPLLAGADEYARLGCVPGGSRRNFDSYGHKLGPMSDLERILFCDPQTSGGLLIAVEPGACATVERVGAEHGLRLSPIGECLAARECRIEIG